MKKDVEEKGYDTYMIYINTTLEVALQRNEKRDRVLPQKIVAATNNRCPSKTSSLSPADRKLSIG